MIYLIAIICFGLFLYLVRFSVFGIPTTLLEIMIYCAAILTLILRVKSKKDKYQPKTKKNNNYNLVLIVPIVLFILSGVTSVVIAPDKRVAMGLFKAYIFDPILLFLVLTCFIKDLKQAEIVIKSLILSGVFVAIYAIYQKIFDETTADSRVFGIFVLDRFASPNYLSLYLAPILVLLNGFEMTLVKKDKNGGNFYKKIWPYDIAFILIILALWFSGSRAGIISSLAGILIYFFLRSYDWFKNNKKFIIFPIVLFLIFLFLGWNYIKPDWNISPEEGGRISSSNNIRWEIWKTTIKDIIPKDNNWFLGVGLGNYQNYFTDISKDRVNFPEYISPWALTPHNIFLTIWVNLGLVGLISFIWILVVFFNNIIRRFSNLSYVFAAVIISILVYGLVDSPYWKNDLACFFWIMIALSFVKAKHK